MKKKSESRIAKVLARIFDIRTWFDLERMKSFTLYVGHAFQVLFMPKQKNDDEKTKNSPQLESFIAAQQNLKLSDTDVKQREVALLRLSLLMVFFALCIFGYSGYHLIYGSLRASALSFIVMLVALALAFRYHFWYYQFKSRQLGCSFHEWFRKGLLGGKE